MDALSRILESFHITGSLLAFIDCSGEWGVDFSAGQELFENHVVPFHYLVSGDCYLLTDAAPPQHLKSDDMVILPGSVSHNLAATPDSFCRTVYEVLEEQGLPVWVPGTTLDQPILLKTGNGLGTQTKILSGVFNLRGPGTKQLLDQLPATVHIKASQSSLNPQLKTMLEFVLCEARSPLPGYTVVASRLVDVLFIQILRSIMLTMPIQAGWLKGLADPQIGAVLSALHKAPQKSWTVEEMGRIGYLSRTAFVNRFRELVGTTPMRYLTEWRIHLAAEALATGDKRICSIGEEIGYPVSQSFTRVFRQETGMSPLEYRQLARQQAKP